MASAVEIIASVVGIICGLSLAFGGWSSLSLGARSLFVTTQFISGFGMYECGACLGFIANVLAICILTGIWVFYLHH